MQISSQRLDVIELHSCLTKFDMNSDMEIDRNRNVGITSLMKGYASYLDDFAHYMENAGFPSPVFD